MNEEIKIKTIRIERLINLGNYENIRIGGEFILPQEESLENATQQALKELEKQIEALMQHNEFTIYDIKQIERVHEEIKNWQQKFLDTDTEHELAINTIEKIYDTISDLMNIVAKINKKLSTLFETIEKIKSKANITEDELHNLYPYFNPLTFMNVPEDTADQIFLFLEKIKNYLSLNRYTPEQYIEFENLTQQILEKLK